MASSTSATPSTLNIQEKLDKCGLFYWDGAENRVFELSEAFARFLGAPGTTLRDEDITRYIDLNIFRLRCEYLKRTNDHWDAVLRIGSEEKVVRFIRLGNYLDDEGIRHWVGTAAVVKEKFNNAGDILRTAAQQPQVDAGKTQVEQLFDNVEGTADDEKFFISNLNAFVASVKKVRNDGGFTLGLWQRTLAGDYVCVQAMADMSKDRRIDFRRGDRRSFSFFGRTLLFGDPVMVTDINDDLAAQYPSDAAHVRDCDGMEVGYMGIRGHENGQEWGFLECIADHHHDWVSSDALDFRLFAMGVSVIVEQSVYNRSLRNRILANSLVCRYGGIYYYFWDLEHNRCVEMGSDGLGHDILFKNCVHADDTLQLNDAMLNLGKDRGSSFVLRLRLHTHDSQIYRWFEVTGAVANFLPSGLPAVVVAAARDIDESIRREAEERRKLEEQKAIYDNLPVVVAFLDVFGNLRYINNRASEFFAVDDTKSLLGISIFEDPNLSEEEWNIIRNNDNSSFQIKYNFQLVKETGFMPTERLDTLDVTIRISKLYRNNKFDGYMLVFVDTSMASAQQRQLLIHDSIFAEVGRFAQVGICVLGPTGFFTPQWNINLGLPADTPACRIAIECDGMEKADLDFINANLQKMNQRLSNSFHYEATITHPDRRREVSFHFLRSALDDSLVAVSLDITEHKELEESLVKSLRRAEQMDSLRSHFFNNVSHELRTPLNAIVGFSGLIAEKEKDGEMKRYANIVKANNVALLRLVDDILEMSLVQTGDKPINRSMTDVRALMEQIGQQLSHRATPEVSFDCRADAALDALSVFLDRQSVIQVICRMADNAFNKTQQGYVRITAEVAGRELRFHVYDTGCGISQQKLDSIFNPFVKIDNFDTGAGLGLSICIGLAHLMGGDITLESTLGRGTHACLSLPLYLSPIEAHNETTDNNVLVLSDNNELRLSLSLLMPCNNIIRCEPYDFSKRWMDSHPPISIIDARLCPEVVLRHVSNVRLFGRRYHIVVINGTESGLDDSQLREAGADEVLLAPVKMRALVEAMGKSPSSNISQTAVPDFVIE